MAKRKYRVKEGYRHGPNDEFGPGSILDLEDDEVQYIMDKLELAEVTQNVPDDTSETVEPSQTTTNSPETSGNEDNDTKAEKPSKSSRKKSGE